MHRIDGPGATVDNKFTDGDPVGGTQATMVTDDWLNDVQEELISILTAGSVTPVKGTQNQVLAAIRAVAQKQAGHGQCRLSVTSATQLKLSPLNGCNILINGVPSKIPSAGITISNAALVANTTYYVYVFIASGVMTLFLSTTGHAQHTDGVEIFTGDPNVTLVGMIRTNASAQFVNSVTQRFCLNWFNRRPVLARNGFAASRTTTSTTLVDLSTSEHADFLIWGDDTLIASSSMVMTQNTAASINAMLAVNFNGGSYSGVDGFAFVTVQTVAGAPIAATVTASLPNTTDGLRSLALFGGCAATFTGTWIGASLTGISAQVMG